MKIGKPEKAKRTNLQPGLPVSTVFSGSTPFYLYDQCTRKHTTHIHTETQKTLFFIFSRRDTLRTIFFLSVSRRLFPFLFRKLFSVARETEQRATGPCYATTLVVLIDVSRRSLVFSLTLSLYVHLLSRSRTAARNRRGNQWKKSTTRALVNRHLCSPPGRRSLGFTLTSTYVWVYVYVYERLCRKLVAFDIVVKRDHQISYSSIVIKKTRVRRYTVGMM